MTSTATDTFAAFDFGLDSEQEERAQRLHTESIVIDMLFQGPCGYRCYTGLQLPQPTGGLEADFYELKQLPVRQALAGQLDSFRGCWELSGITAGNRQAGFLPPSDRGFALAQAQFDTFPWLLKALRASDIRAAKEQRLAAGFVTTQDTDGVDRKLERLEVAYELGARMIGLTYNSQNSVGGGCTDRVDAGVSNFGATVIRRMNELGIIVDTAHSGPQTTRDACELSERPVVASHTSAGGLFSVDRAKTDQEIQAIAATGGVVGIYAIPFFLTDRDEPTIMVMLDHIEYVSALVGWEHVGIGTDWPLQADRRTLETTFLALMRDVGFRDEHRVGMGNLRGFDDYRDFPNVTRGLVSRGFNDEQIRGILGENFLRVFEAVCG